MEETKEKLMAGKLAKRKVELEARRRSLLHSYDSFLVAQARIFTLASFVFNRISLEVENQQEQLFFDDIVAFGIAARRLIELANIKPFANHITIDEQVIGGTDARISIEPSGKTIGFLTFVNSIIHAKYIQLFRSRFDFWSIRSDSNGEQDSVAFYNLIVKTRRENRWHEFAVDVSVAIVSDSDRLVMVRLKDVVEAASEVVDKVVERCDQVGIYLEKDMRS